MAKRFLEKIIASGDLIFLTLLSFFTRFFNLSYPAKVIFDETYFGLYATKYLSHQYYFDMHPPFGKLLLSLFALIGKIKPGFIFAPNSSYNDFNFLSLRFLTAFLGSLLILLLYFFVKELGFSRRVAFLSSFLILFDNAVLVESRFILLNIILLFFIFLSFYLFLFLRKFPVLSKKWYFFSLLLVLTLGAVISTKLIGFGILGIIWFLMIFQENLFSKPKKEILVKLILFLLIPLLLYFLFFVIHLKLLYKACENNCGVALEYADYKKKTLEIDGNIISLFKFHNTPLPGNIFKKLITVNTAMLSSNILGTVIYYYESDWFSWPFMMRPIKYFEEKNDGKTTYIYFLGNPLVWWLGLIGVLGYFYLIARNYLYHFKMKIPKNFYSQGAFILFLSYFAYWLPFASISRFVLLYHYLPSLIFSVIIFSFFFEGTIQMKWEPFLSSKKGIFFQNKKANFIFFGFLGLVFLIFLYFSPLSYGIPLTDTAFKARMWLPTWSF